MKKYIYLDYAATTPVDPGVKKAMNPYFSTKYGNTSSVHFFGQEARKSLDKSRNMVAKLINANPDEIIFTASATESNNIAIKGLALNLSSFSINDKKNKDKNRIIISSIEHPSVLETVEWLEKKGFNVTKIKVDRNGFLNLKDLEKEIDEKTLLVSLIHASNEIGTIQPINKISDICRRKKTYLHIDSTQALGKIPIDVKEMQVDMISGSSHKIYGPKGVGFLFVRRGTKVSSLFRGGSHEFNLRPSTVNLSGIVGFSKACEILIREMDNENKRIAKLRNKLIKEVLKIKGAYLNGPICYGENDHITKRISNNANFRFSFIEGESLMVNLDLMGFSVSTGSACSSTKLQVSHVLLATGLKHEEAEGSLRISLGRWTTEEEINSFVKTLRILINKLRTNYF
jgi:cysteine desulfurase